MITPRPRGWPASWLAAPLAVLVLLCVAVPAKAYIYYTNYGTGAIRRANLDDTDVNKSFITASSAPGGIAVDGAHIYWTNGVAGTIGRANLDGTGVDQRFITGANSPGAVAVDSAHIYWTNESTGTISRASLDGTGVNNDFMTGAIDAYEIAVDGAHIYWIKFKEYTIGRANLDGSGVDQSFITSTIPLLGIAVDGAHIYWSDADGAAIGRANLDGTGVDQIFIPGASAGPVAVDGAHIYWGNINADYTNSGGTIGRANLDGTGANNSFIPDYYEEPSGVAVDALGPPGPPPTQPVKTGVYINCQNRREVNGSLTQTLIPLRHPRTCVVYGQPESISTLYPLVRAHWKGWGKATATVNATWDNPSPREGPPSPIRAKAYRIRRGCDGHRFYTRVSVPGFRHTTIVLHLSAACKLPPL